MTSFVGKVALITGASSGIGAATAKLFSQMGATLSLSGRNLDNLQRTAQDCMRREKPLLIQADVGNETEAKMLVEKTIKELGHIDILINNAGMYNSCITFFEVH